MSEELKGETGATIPAESIPPAPNAAPVAPTPAEAPQPAEASQAAIDAASTPAPAEPPAQSAPEAAAAEQPQVPAEAQDSEPTGNIELTEEEINSAIDLVKKTGRSSAAHFQKKLGWDLKAVEKLLDILTEKKVLGPKEGNAPRKILIELPEKAKPAPKPQPQPKPQTPKPAPANRPQKKRPMNDYERFQAWKGHLKEIGHYENDEFIEAMGQYALANPGFNKNSKWGSCLIVMVNRLSNRLRNSLRTFNASDAEYLQKELTRFFSEKPLGDCPTVWNETYTTNYDQKKVISQFFGIDCSYRDLRGKQNVVMTAVRDAAWPTRDEESHGTGGTFAERFNYLCMCICRFVTSGFADAMFSVAYHNEPTEEFLNRVGGNNNGGFRGGRREAAAPSWIKDGHCTVCGAEIKKDSQGNDVCSNFMCEHSIARVATDVAKSFRQGNKPSRDNVESITIDPSNAPLPVKDNRKKNWKDKKRDRRDDNESQFARGPKKHGKRFRVNDGDDDFEAPSNPNDGGVTVSATPGSENFGSMAGAFDGLKIPTVDAKEPNTPEAPAPEAAPAETPAPTAEGEGLPPPPPEAPVV